MEPRLKRPVALSSSAARAEAYLAYAKDAEGWANRATSPETRQSFLAIAAGWRQLALDVNPTLRKRQ